MKHYILATLAPVYFKDDVDGIKFSENPNTVIEGRSAWSASLDEVQAQTIRESYIVEPTSEPGFYEVWFQGAQIGFLIEQGVGKPHVKETSEPPAKVPAPTLQTTEAFKKFVCPICGGYNSVCLTKRPCAACDYDELLSPGTKFKHEYARADNYGDGVIESLRNRIEVIVEALAKTMDAIEELNKKNDR